MIFYFTATGNSLAAAKALQRENEALVDMAKANKDGAFTYDLAPGERVGFVFPVYYYTVGDVVYDFVTKLTLKGSGYVFAVVTCGGSIGGTGGLLKELLEKRGVSLQYVRQLVMPDDTIFYYNIDSAESAAPVLQQAAAELQQIKAEIDAETKNKIAPVGTAKLTRKVYHLMSGTKPFFADDGCIGCGQCERNCPCGAIRMENGKPQWVKKNCVKCTSCINRCPKQAIQYGKKTASRNRYCNPMLK